MEEGEDLFEMSNIRKNESGLPMNIYISSGGSVNHRHAPRIKAMKTNSDRFNPNDTFSVILKPDITEDDVVGYDKISPEIIAILRDYINLNYETLMLYWTDQISTRQCMDRLKSI